MKKSIHRYCGREFTQEEIRKIKHLIETNPDDHRLRLSFKVCDLLNWYRIDGKSKDMSCRVAMLRMEKDGLIKLPPPRKLGPTGRRAPKLTQLSQPGFPIDLPVGKLGVLEVVLVKTVLQSRIWNEHIERYHYLGYTPLPGAQLRYLIYCSSGLLSVMGFGASAWQCEDRDKWIGWTHTQRKKHLSLIINNARFLVLPWVKSKNLASKLLATIAKRIVDDWFAHYGYRPVLMETFVDSTRFKGTCYLAANWTDVGKTKGRGKLGDNKASVPIKKILVFPLASNFRKLLTSD